MELVGMIEKSKEQKGSEQENEQMNKKMNELEMKVRSLEVEKEQEKQEKIKAFTENDKLKQKVSITEQEKQKELQEKEKVLSENARLTTENQQLKSELSKLRPLTTSPEQQSKPEPKLQQIQQSGPSSLNPNMLVGIIPDNEDAAQTGNKIIHAKDNNKCTSVAFNPIISSGFVRFGGFYENHSNDNFMIGIADSVAVFGSDEYPWKDENDKKTVTYWKKDGLYHNGSFILGNSEIEENKSIAMEVNMNIRPRTLTFFYDNQEQPV
ncbi:MAG: hypothetical protein EZS28_045588, partial [Streblomastix strix]